MATQSLEEAFYATGETVIDDAFWNRFLLELAARFRGLEGIKISWEEVSRQGIDLALARINETIGPASERIRLLSELGFLIASSTTPATLGNGQVLDLVVTEGNARDLFTPSPFVMLGRTLSAEDFGVAKLRTYDRATGALQVEVVTFAGDPGPHSDWTIGAIAGSTLAQLLMLDQGRQVLADSELARDAANDNRDQAVTARQAAEAARDTATGARDSALAYRDTAKTYRDQAQTAAAAAALFDPALYAPKASPQLSGQVEITQALALSGVLQPPQLAADANDYAPAGLDAAAVVYLTATAAWRVTGIAAPAKQGRVLVLVNNSEFELTLAEESPASVGANRIWNRGLGGANAGASTPIQPGQAAVLIYLGTRWRVLVAPPPLAAIRNFAVAAALSW